AIAFPEFDPESARRSAKEKLVFVRGKERRARGARTGDNVGNQKRTRARAVSLPYFPSQPADIHRKEQRLPNDGCFIWESIRKALQKNGPRCRPVGLPGGGLRHK